MQGSPDAANTEDMTPSGELEAPGAQASTRSPVTPSEAAATGTGESLEAQLKTAQAKAAEHHDAWLRAKAETDNVRKRAQSEIASAHRFAVENFAAELLAVKDSLEAALTAEGASAESMKSGIEVTLKQLASVFDRFNLSELNPQGQKFDPHRHQAIGTVESEAEPGSVVQVLQKGYLLHDRVIRPALVTVSKARSIEK